MHASTTGIFDVERLNKDYEKRRPHLAKALTALRKELRKVETMLKTLDVLVVHKTANAKSFDSFLRKVIEKGKYDNPFAMSDLVRARVVLLNLQDVALATRFLQLTLWNGRTGRP